MTRLSERAVFLAGFDRCARTSMADSWEASWLSLLGGCRRFDFLKEAIPDWPDNNPTACLRDWPSGFELAGRSQALGRALGYETKPLYSQLIRFNPDIKLTIIIATSHGESYAISQFTEYSIGRSPSLQLREAEAILCDGFLAAFLDGLGAFCPGITISAACASASVAAGLATTRIRRGLCDACLVVSVDVISRIAHAGFQQIGAMSKNGCRPFDSRRDGITIGEAGVVILMAGAGVVLPHTLRWTVKVLGYGQSCDARHPVEPSADGICDAIQNALAEAALVPSDLAAVYWHGTGTIQNDRTEAEVARRIFGDDAPPGTSTKGTFGHAMGASAALSMLAAGETIQSNFLPPVAGLEYVEFPNLNLVKGQFKEIVPGPVAIIALGFGGINAALVLGAP